VEGGFRKETCGPKCLLHTKIGVGTVAGKVSNPRSIKYVICPFHLIFLDSITVTIFGEENRARNSSLWSLFRSPITSNTLKVKIRFTLEQTMKTHVGVNV
jgi:hypothetical protein